MAGSGHMIVMGLQWATQWDSLASVGCDGFLSDGMPSAAVNSFVCTTWTSFDKSSST